MNSAWIVAPRTGALLENACFHRGGRQRALMKQTRKCPTGSGRALGPPTPRHLLTCWRCHPLDPKEDCCLDICHQGTQIWWWDGLSPVFSASSWQWESRREEGEPRRWRPSVLRFRVRELNGHSLEPAGTQSLYVRSRGKSGAWQEVGSPCALGQLYVGSGLPAQTSCPHIPQGSCNHAQMRMILKEVCPR